VHPYFEAPLPRLFAHRGASAQAPENTLPAFERASEIGASYLETDCQATADGEIVLLHDAELERTTDGKGPVGAHTWRELSQLDAGYHFTHDGHRFPFRGTGVRVPRLGELLEALPAARVNLEIKGGEPSLVDAVVDEIRRCEASKRVLLTAAEDAVMSRIHARDPDTALGSSIADVVGFVQAVAEERLDALRPRGHALQIPTEFMGQALVTPACIAAAHRVGLEVHVWTINEPKEMRRLLGLGVDGIMSDDPARLVALATAES
jgi:glycerophosphoryl diester phosphodiesterase